MKKLLLIIGLLFSTTGYSQQYKESIGYAYGGLSLSSKPISPGLSVGVGYRNKYGVNLSLNTITETRFNGNFMFPMEVGYTRTFYNNWEWTIAGGYRLYKFSDDSDKKWKNKNGEGITSSIRMRQGIKMFKLDYHVPDKLYRFTIALTGDFILSSE